MHIHLKFIPNILVEKLNLTPNLVNEQGLKIVKPEYRAPLVFNELGITISFIDNGGVQLQVIISYLLSVTIFELIYSKLAKKQRKGKMVQTLET